MSEGGTMVYGSGEGNTIKSYYAGQQGLSGMRSRRKKKNKKGKGR